MSIIEKAAKRLEEQRRKAQGREEATRGSEPRERALDDNPFADFDCLMLSPRFIEGNPTYDRRMIFQ